MSPCSTGNREYCSYTSPTLLLPSSVQANIILPSGAPVGVPTVMSRLATADYYQRQCSLFFPTEGNSTFRSALGVREDYVNDRTGGWFNTDAPRFLYVNGEFE